MIKNLLLILFLINTNIYCQKKQLELVSFKNDKINNILTDLVTSKHTEAVSNGYFYWYIKELKSEYYLVTISEISTLLNVNMNRKKYITLIKDSLIFIIIDDEKIISKTGFYVDFSNQTNNEIEFSFRDLSHWIIKVDKEEAEIIHEKKYGNCKK